MNDMSRDAMIEALAQAISKAIIGKTATRGGMDAAAAVLAWQDDAQDLLKGAKP